MVVIRLARHGAHKRPFYRIVVADRRKARNGAIIEQIGTYDATKDPSVVDIDVDKAQEWISKGAQPSERVWKLLASVSEDIELPQSIQKRSALKAAEKKAAQEAAKKKAEAEAKKKAEEEAAAEAEAEAEESAEE